MEDHNKPVFLLIAGPNGSGKSTLTKSGFASGLLVIDPDAISLKLSQKGRFDNSFAAGREALRQQKLQIQQGEGFAIETTLSGNSALRLMDEAKNAGFQIELAYIRTDDVTINLHRVAGRVANGGHDIPPDDIMRRFKRSLENLPAAISKSDSTIMFDNTGEELNMIAKLVKNKYKFEKNAPDWATTAAYQATLISYNAAEDLKDQQQWLKRLVEATQAKGADANRLEELQIEFSKQSDGKS